VTEAVAAAVHESVDAVRRQVEETGEIPVRAV